MMKHAAICGSILALGVSGAALAQDAGSGMSPMSMTCADIADMDEGQAEGAIYFVAGYEASSGGAMGTAGGVTGVTGTAATTDSGASATGTTGTALPSTGTETDTTAGAASGMTGMGTESGMGSISFEDIQVSEILSACEDSPDQLVSAVLREHMGGDDSN
jgi:hypothetical protein